MIRRGAGRSLGLTRATPIATLALGLAVLTFIGAPASLVAQPGTSATPTVPPFVDFEPSPIPL